MHRASEPLSKELRSLFLYRLAWDASNISGACINVY